MIFRNGSMSLVGNFLLRFLCSFPASLEIQLLSYYGKTTSFCPHKQLYGCEACGKSSEKLCSYETTNQAFGWRTKMLLRAGLNMKTKVYQNNTNTPGPNPSHAQGTTTTFYCHSPAHAKTNPHRNVQQVSFHACNYCCMLSFWMQIP